MGTLRGKAYPSMPLGAMSGSFSQLISPQSLALPQWSHSRRSAILSSSFSPLRHCTRAPSVSFRRADGQPVRWQGASCSATSAAASAAVTAPVLSPSEIDDLRTQLDTASALEIMDKVQLTTASCVASIVSDLNLSAVVAACNVVNAFLRFHAQGSACSVPAISFSLTDDSTVLSIRLRSGLGAVWGGRGHCLQWCGGRGSHRARVPHRQTISCLLS